MFRKAPITFLPFLVLFLIFQQCAYNDISEKVDCSTSTLALSLASKTDVTTCKSIDGTLTVEATGGTAPYDYSVNGGSFQTNNQFENLGAGTYSVEVKDKNNCTRTLSVTINAAGSTLAATASTTADDQCTTNNGSVTVVATGGKSPYQFQIDSNGYGSSSTFSNLKDGQHIVIVKDAEECQTTLSVQVPRGNTGISYSNEIKNILTTSCNLSGCHGAGTGARDWSNINNLKTNAANIKLRTSNKTMPPGTPLPQEQIDKIACWADDGAPTNN